MDELNRQKDILTHANTSLSEENRLLKSSIQVSKDTLEGLEAEETTRSKHIAELTTQEDELMASISALDDSLRAKQKQLDVLEREYTVKHERYSKELQVLEEKQRNISQEVVLSMDEIQGIRTELATRQKLLDERDKNLRIREEKVSQSEKTIARNYNLLNL